MLPAARRKPALVRNTASAPPHPPLSPGSRPRKDSQNTCSLDRAKLPTCFITISRVFYGRKSGAKSRFVCALAHHISSESLRSHHLPWPTVGASCSAILLCLSNVPRRQPCHCLSGPNGCHHRIQHWRSRLVWYVNPSAMNPHATLTLLPIKQIQSQTGTAG